MPERPRPDWISSATISTLVSLHSARTSRRKPSGGMITPPSPWIGSSSTATVRLVDRGPEGGDVAVRHHPEAGRVRRVAAVASESLLKLTIVVVRPWKLPSITMIEACASGTPLTW